MWQIRRMSRRLSSIRLQFEKFQNDSATNKTRHNTKHPQNWIEKKWTEISLLFVSFIWWFVLGLSIRIELQTTSNCRLSDAKLHFYNSCRWQKLQRGARSANASFIFLQPNLAATRQFINLNTKWAASEKSRASDGDWQNWMPIQCRRYCVVFFFSYYQVVRERVSANGKVPYHMVIIN